MSGFLHADIRVPEMIRESTTSKKGKETPCSFSMVNCMYVCRNRINVVMEFSHLTFVQCAEGIIHVA